MSFQLAKFSLTLHPASIQFMRDVTPPELMILQQLHFKESSGSPIGADLQLQSNTAVTVDVDEKPFEPEYFHSGTGKIVPAKPVIPAVTHTRTNREEIARLSKKYKCPVPHNPGSKNVFIELFGSSPAVNLPQTFDEVLPSMNLIDEATGKGLILPADVIVAADPMADDLNKLLRHELVTKAAALKLTVRQTDSKEMLIGKIVAAEKAKSEPATL